MASAQVIFSNTSSGNPTNYLWDFGDGSQSTAASPVHTFANSGVYIVRLTAVSGNSQTTISKPVPVLSGGTLGFSLITNSAGAILANNESLQLAAN